MGWGFWERGSPGALGAYALERAHFPVGPVISPLSRAACARLGFPLRWGNQTSYRPGCAACPFGDRGTP